MPHHRIAPLALITFLALASMGSSQDTTTSGPLDRVLQEAVQQPAWRSARHQVERLTLLRDAALRKAAQSDPVSDRYVITALAGPVDLVRFLGLARIVCSGRDRRASLLKEWQKENGAGRALAKPLDLTPEDLPSNALGALFGEELRPQLNNLQHDVADSLRTFFRPLEPQPDSVVRSLTFERAVLGLPASATTEERDTAHSWTTAMPVYLIPAVAPEKTGTYPDSASALKAAGLELRKHQDLLIILERIGTPEPEPKVTKAVPVPEKRPTPARAPRPPVRKPVTRAVPVE
jgi:hypothetical protein